MTMNNVSRRTFLHAASALTAGTGLMAMATDLTGQDTAPLGDVPKKKSGIPDVIPPMRSRSGKVKFQLGIASYSFRLFDRAQAIAWTKALRLHYISFKDAHLPLSATDAECAAAAAECAKNGMFLTGCGTVTFGSKENIDNAFRYAKAAGMQAIICTIGKGGKPEELLPYLETKVKEGNVVAAIHNHGPGDKHFPTAIAVYDKVKNLDNRIGFCIDIGHTKRIGGDPIADLKVCPERIFDVHFKDIDAADEKGGTCILGTGVLDLAKIVETLIEIGYDKRLSFEYERSGNDPFPCVAESVGYARGLIATY